MAHENITWAAGPWRTSGQWWLDTCDKSNDDDLACWEREEWDIALATTHRTSTAGRDRQIARQIRETRIALYRIFREGRTGEWFVQGAYD